MPLTYPSTVRLLALSASLALGTAYTARADDSAGQSPFAISANVSQTPAGSALEVAKAQAESAKGKVTEISARLDSDREQAKQIRLRMFSGESTLPAMQAKAENAVARGAARRQELAAEGSRFGQLREAYEQAKLDAIRDFNTSAEYRAALDAIKAAAANVRELSAGSDSDMQAAQARVASAKAALDDLRRRFTEEQLPRDPKVATAEQPLKIEQARCDELVAAIKTADQEAADAQAALKQQTDGLSQDRVALEELTADLSRCEAELPGAQADADKANNDLNRVIAAANAVPQAPNAYAAAPYSQPATVYRSSPYAVYSPAAVYGQPCTVFVQPGTVYARTPLYGSYVVGSRPYVYGAGVRVYSSRVYVGHRVGHR